MVLTTIRMAVGPKKQNEALRILRSTTELDRVKQGCVSSRIYEDVQEENVLMFEEIWKTEEDLERHLRSDEYLRILLVLEMALKQPEIRFDTISSSTGIETIQEARSRAR